MMTEADTEMEVMAALLPAWFSSRMMYDQWSFGLMMTNGTVIGIANIKSIIQDTAGELWLDVEMLANNDLVECRGKFKVFVAPTGRLTASIQARHIMAAFELCST